jgi:hypothetical protein
VKARFGDSKLKTNLKGSGCDTKNFFWLMPGSFIQQSGLEKRVRELCSKADDSKAEATPPVCSLLFPQMCRGR